MLTVRFFLVNVNALDKPLTALCSVSTDSDIRMQVQAVILKHVKYKLSI